MCKRAKQLRPTECFLNAVESCTRKLKAMLSAASYTDILKQLKALPTFLERGHRIWRQDNHTFLAYNSIILLKHSLLVAEYSTLQRPGPITADKMAEFAKAMCQCPL